VQNYLLDKQSETLQKQKQEIGREKESSPYLIFFIILCAGRRDRPLLDATKKVRYNRNRNWNRNRRQETRRQASKLPKLPPIFCLSPHTRTSSHKSESALKLTTHLSPHRSLDFRSTSKGLDSNNSNSKSNTLTNNISNTRSLDAPRPQLRAAASSSSSTLTSSTTMSSPPSGSGGGAVTATFLEQTVSLLGSAASYMRLPAIASTVRPPLPLCVMPGECAERDVGVVSPSILAAY
jgi:hypothetical protein